MDFNTLLFGSVTIMLTPVLATVYIATLLKPGIVRAFVLFITYIVTLLVIFGLLGGWPAIPGATFGTPIGIIVALVWIYINDKKRRI